MRPCIQPTASPAASDDAVASITSSSDTTVNCAPAAREARLHVVLRVGGAEIGAFHDVTPAVGLALVAEELCQAASAAPTAPPASPDAG